MDFSLLVPLSGFKINWNRYSETVDFTASSFNPQQGLRLIGTFKNATIVSSNPLFQSLVGFKINWNICSLVGCILNSKFQSLVGFKINWNYFSNTQARSKNRGFNPQQGLRLIGTSAFMAQTQEWLSFNPQQGLRLIGTGLHLFS